MEKHINATASASASAAAPPSTLTTFVQADANTFRELVQKLTGFAASDDTEKHPVALPGAGARTTSKPSLPGDHHPKGPRRPVPYKLQERRQHTMRKLEIKLGLTTIRNSPSHCSRRLESPIPSPVTPLGSESLFHYYSSGTVSSPSSPAVSEEEKAIAEKGFYLHPSPLNTPRARGNQPPELLTLFPLTSPKRD